MAKRKDPGALSHVNPLGEMPTKINTTEPGNMHAVPEQPTLTFTSGTQVLDEGIKMVQAGVAAKDPAMVRLGLLMMLRAVLWFFGGNDYLTAIDNPTNAALVSPAAQAYLQNARTLQEHAPALTMAVDDDHIKATYRHLSELQALLLGLAPILEAFSRLGVHLTRDLADHLTIINDIARRAIETNISLNANMQAFNEWATSAIKLALESRKNNEQQVAKGFDNAIEMVKEAMEQAKKNQPAPGAPAPAPAPVDLDALKSGRNRNRGGGRSTPRK